MIEKSQKEGGKGGGEGGAVCCDPATVMWPTFTFGAAHSYEYVLLQFVSGAAP